MADASSLSTKAIVGKDASAANGAATSATAELYRTNLLRLEATQLLSESVLSLSPFIGELDREVKWSDYVRKYVEAVKEAIGGMEQSELTPDHVAMPSSIDGKAGGRKYWVDLSSDKFIKHASGAKWSFPFPGGHSLQIEPAGEYGAGGAGLTNPRGNALCLPMIDLAILLPNDSSIVCGKDYLNGRYFDKQNILAVHVAKVLSQKKYRKKIGAIHISTYNGDTRRVVLILSPPVPEDTNEGSDLGEEAKSKNRRKGSNKKLILNKPGQKKKGGRKFRVRLLFGVQGNSLNDNCWIPRARLFPDRCNNSMSAGHNSDREPTPTYTNSISRDLHHLTTARIIHDMTKVCKAFNEALVLAKIWSLQRGYLRGHDTFDTTSLSLLIVFLYRTKMVGTRMGAIQVFTILMKFIAETDWLGEGVCKTGSDNFEDTEGLGTGHTIRHSASEGYQDLRKMASGDIKLKAAIVLPEEGSTEAKTIQHCVQAHLYKDTTEMTEQGTPRTLIECYKANCSGPIFLDPTMTVNYFGSISASCFREVQDDAKKAINSLHMHSDESGLGALSVGPFHNLFLDGCRFWKRYDAFVHINLESICTQTERSYFSADSVPDVGTYESYSRAIIKIMRMALGDRITAIRALTSGNGELALMQNTSDADSICDTDQTPSIPVRGGSVQAMEDWGFAGGESIHSTKSPFAIGTKRRNVLVLGLRINSQTSHRIVDRGPPADDNAATASFIGLWGKEKAQLRRFKDGAIVRAVLWNGDSASSNGYVRYSGDEKLGGVVERIIHHIVKLHFLRTNAAMKSLSVGFGLRDVLSLVEGADSGNEECIDSNKMHKDIMSSFELLSTFLKQNSIPLSTSPVEKQSQSKLGLPLSIDAVEPLSPSLRYAELFPPQPHPLLGGNKRGRKKVAGVIVSDPLLIQLRFEGNSKWPTNIEAIAAAKCALLIQLAEGIETMKRNGASECASFDGPMNSTPTYLDLGFRGYSWRIMIGADQELKVLNSLRKPTTEAAALRRALIERHILSAMHHSLIHSVNTQHPTAGLTTRLAMRWVHSHMLSGLLSQEAVEILVSKVYVDPQPFDSPSTVVSAFLRFLRLLSSYDWAKQPLVFDPQGYFSAEDHSRIRSDFETIRGESSLGGPPMFIISSSCLRSQDQQSRDLSMGPSNKSQKELCMPTFTRNSPEAVVLSRLITLAKRTEQFLVQLLVSGDSASSNSWASAFQESPSSLKSYSILLRVNAQLVVDSDSSSTGSDMSIETVVDVKNTPFKRSTLQRSLGPKPLKIQVYRNVGSSVPVLHGWRPIEDLVHVLRKKYGSHAVIFYNKLAPDVIGMLWRPTAFKPLPFSAMLSEQRRPLEDDWQEDCLTVINAQDLIREIRHIARDVVDDMKVFEDKSIPWKAKENVKSKIAAGKKRKGGQLEKQTEKYGSESTSDSEED